MAAVENVRLALFAAAAAAFAAMLALPPLLGFSVDYASFYPLLVIAAIPGAVLPYAIWRRLDPLRPALETTALGLLATLPVLVFTYSAMRAGLPLADPLLARMDRAIGFDWSAFFRLVDGSEAAARLLAYGYSSFAYQLLFLPTLLCLARLPGRAYRLVLAYLILCTLSSAIGIFFPADGAYVFYAIDPATLQHVNGKFGHLFLESFHGVREGGAFSLGMDNVAGILTFPSVHAGVAALCAWAAWPSRWLRWPFVALNVVMSVSALTHGAHYLVDIFAGFAVAALAVVLVRRAERIAAAYRQGRLPAAIPLPG